jgi:hypothetical protein
LVKVKKENIRRNTSPTEEDNYDEREHEIKTIRLRNNSTGIPPSDRERSMAENVKAKKKDKKCKV